MVAFNEERTTPRRFTGRFLGLRCPPMSGCWGLVLGLPGGRERIFWGDWRPVRDALEALGLRPGDGVQIRFEAEWVWSLGRTADSHRGRLEKQP